MKVVEL